MLAVYLYSALSEAGSLLPTSQPLLYLYRGRGWGGVCWEGERGVEIFFPL